MKENRNLEYKESVTNTFLKTVSAFANYGTGEIFFGISDGGEEKGIENPNQACLDIENRINDSIDPVPHYLLEINKNSIIKLTVHEGVNKPYFYKSKAYRRNDTATIEVDRLELTRLILEGKDISFEELPANEKNLEFNILSEKLKTSLNINSVTEDTLKTLELTKSGQDYNIAGELLADRNSFCGIDIVRFGESINIILDREIFEKESILLQYDQTLEMFRKYYQYEIVRGAVREQLSIIPEEAFREAVANALTHRVWDVNAHINISMFADRIEITSPGGLPKGMTESEYLNGGLSLPRNRIIATVLLRLGIIERFGTGIRRIMESYQLSRQKPIFKISDSAIHVTLPVINENNSLSEDENKVFEAVKGKLAASSLVVKETGFGKSKVVSILNRLVDAGYVQTIGNGRGLKYTAEEIRESTV